MKIYREEHGTFRHNKKHYDINKIFKIVHDKPIKRFYIKDLKWILNHTKVDKNRVEKASLHHPIIVTKENNRYIVVDGVHRLSKLINIWKNRTVTAKKLSPFNTMQINAKYLTKKELDSTLIK
jgi:hypothetical protein